MPNREETAVVPPQPSADALAAKAPWFSFSFWIPVVGALVSAALAIAPDEWVKVLGVPRLPPHIQPFATLLAINFLNQARQRWETWYAANTQGPSPGTRVTVAGEPKS